MAETGEKEAKGEEQGARESVLFEEHFGGKTGKDSTKEVPQRDKGDKGRDGFCRVAEGGTNLAEIVDGS